MLFIPFLKLSQNFNTSSLLLPPSLSFDDLTSYFTGKLKTVRKKPFLSPKVSNISVFAPFLPPQWKIHSHDYYRPNPLLKLWAPSPFIYSRTLHLHPLCVEYFPFPESLTVHTKVCYYFPSFKNPL